MLEVVKLDTPPDDFLASQVEGGAFCLAFQQSGIHAFEIAYLAVYRAGKRVAVVPYFITDFQLNTMLPEGGTAGRIKPMLAWLKLRIACIGHPSSDLGMIDGEVSEEVLAAVNHALVQQAALVSYKGFSDKLPLPGFVCARGLPVPRLKIVGHYYSGIGTHRRNDFRRKQKKAVALQFREHDGLPEHLVDAVFKLYLNTYEEAAIRFEKLTPDYFRNTAPLSKFLLVYEQEQLIGFAQLLCRKPGMTHKYVGMDYQRNRQYGLYFLLFLKAIDICVRDGYSELEFGVSSYHFKQLLGSDMIETCVYYRHKIPLVNWILGKLRFMLEPSADELK